jgi:glycosyltransferase involved in cell wall biosynthesis
MNGMVIINQGKLNSFLTIGIPTYNRHNEIKKQVSLLLPQLDERVELIVYDNCSDTPIITNFTEFELSKFTLIRNNVNVGGDANIARCFENCKTRWLWTLSDDDFVREDAVKIVLDRLRNNEETVFFNFCRGVSFKSKGFDQLIEEFKNPIVFSSSFTMSSCLYDVGRLNYSLQNYYNHLSSMMGTIILVLKYVQVNKDVICEFVDETLIDSYNEQVGWDYRVYLRRTRLFLDAFNQSDYNNSLNRTLFLGCHITNYYLIYNDRNLLKVSHREKWELFRFVLVNQGILNAFLFCPKTVIRVYFYLLFRKDFVKSILRFKVY